MLSARKVRYIRVKHIDYRVTLCSSNNIRLYTKDSSSTAVQYAINVTTTRPCTADIGFFFGVFFLFLDVDGRSELLKAL